jgi:single-strand DNA-binding protein
MSYSAINRVVLIGRLTRDPDLRTLPSGTPVCGLRIACNASRKDAEGDVHEYPNYFGVNVYGPPAETVAKYTRKGRRVGVDGRLEWREWETDDQQRRQAVSVVADTVQFLDRPGTSNAVGEDAGGGDDQDGELVGVGAEEGEVTF